jgi:cytoskeleton protein RodZ
MPYPTRLVMTEPVQESAMSQTPQVPTMPVMPATAGGILRAAREKSGLHLAVLSVNLKVSIKQLEALEADQYDQLIEPVFARALAAKICRILKIDTEPVLSLMPQMTNGLKPLNLIDPNNESGPQSNRSRISSKGLAFGGPKWWFLILATGILLFGYTSEWHFNVLQTNPKAAVTEVIPTMPPAQEPVATENQQADPPKAMVFESPAPNSSNSNTSAVPNSSN